MDVIPQIVLHYVHIGLHLIVHFWICFKDTIISWRDPENSADLALSFQETTGCNYIW